MIGLPGPLVIGGVGGSGTRVLAQTLQETGFYIGGSLNHALDNLWYTLLLRRATLFPGLSEATDREVANSIRLFEKAMTRGLNGAPSRRERHLVRDALEGSIEEESRDHPGRARRSILASTAPDAATYRAWGWKEPNTHIHLEALAGAFPQMKYVLLIRHGLDMAFSKNRHQLKRWGSFFGVETSVAEAAAPAAALRYWILANRRALELGDRLLGDRFLVVSYDELCREPEAQMSRLLEFIGVEADPETRARLASLPQAGETSGRYLREDCSIFSRDDLEAVESLGFEVRL